MTTVTNSVLRDLDRPESLRERVGRELRTALVTGQLEPGSVYSVPLLASRFGVSATPAREAMLDLVREGLVAPVRNRGFRIVRFDDRALDDCLRLRHLIEPPSIAEVTRLATRDQIQRWASVAHEILAAARACDMTRYIDSDMRFHLGLLSLTGNQLLVDTVRDLRYRSRLFGIPRMAEAGKLVAPAEEHLELLELMLDADAARAEDLMRRHLDHVRAMWARP